MGVIGSIMRAESTVFEDSDLVIRPSINDVGSAAFGQFDDTEQLGYEEGIVRIRDWIQSINRDSPLYRALFETPDMSDWGVCCEELCWRVGVCWCVWIMAEVVGEWLLESIGE